MERTASSTEHVVAALLTLAADRRAQLLAALAIALAVVVLSGGRASAGVKFP